MDEFDLFFKEHFRLTCYGSNFWRAYNKETHESASPVCVGKQAVIDYVKRELKQETDNAIHGMLGGDDEYIRS